MSAPRPSQLPPSSSSSPSSKPASKYNGTPTAEYAPYEYPINPASQPSPPFVSGRAGAGYFPPALVAQQAGKQPTLGVLHTGQGPVPPRLQGMMAGSKQGVPQVQRAAAAR
ncbi:hypothetical protein CALCODRAFT_482640 [Calocera cornea HHB12733]|uniref:Uncharacterized protein n=1 Tax=Calocera cornea HHB12733 TaxID=1353952 RepID=A0A165GIC1_9BASI|nr:hypothetical protein CALCODRAFT_482640 [Calocera cornea HHB12733]